MQIGLILLVIAIVFVIQSVKVVPQQHAWVVERLGKYNGTLTPGLNFLMPFIDRVAYKHVLKEIPLDIPSQVCITRDNTQLQVDGILSSHRCHACQLRLQQLHHGHFAVGTNVPALCDWQAGAR